MTTPSQILPLIFLLCCSPKEETEPSGPAHADSGTDLMQIDTDGDGYSDGEELEAGSDPEDGFDWPEGTGHWPDFSDEATAAGLEGTGWSFDDQIPNFQLLELSEVHIVPCCPPLSTGMLRAGTVYAVCACG